MISARVEATASAPAFLQLVGRVAMGYGHGPHAGGLGGADAGQAVLNHQAMAGFQAGRATGAEGVEGEQVAFGVGLTALGIFSGDDGGEEVA